ncbi:MAG: cation/acetate symporter ActP [Gemmatimonadetes bacterium]|nr:cation/acetate symporter ActP [Gemmatimonadota bacterium]MBK7716977.1 cation/acetate symporter ActP [Gemmatimonadota bacterium]MBK7923116.1 cation/acetate symporter ActP [Gemmatimonadota bacterium]MBK9066172.1 cation/acetate symporter ActP [Gemmatimonadota bacterium]MBK9692846.1 cation/acetate symporter ActP [Gemmatimonadota bacterium]
MTAQLLFFAFLAITLGITWWAARKTRTADHFYAAGRSITALQNGFALAGDYMSASSFLGISGLVALSGFDGLIYAAGGLVGWPIVLFLIAEPLRNLGKYTFADVLAARLRQVPVRLAAAVGTLATVSLYLIAQMVGAGGLIRLLFGLSYEAAVGIVGVAMIAYVLFGGMLATTWVQIVKAALLLAGAMLLTGLVLAQVGFSPLGLFAAAAARQGNAVLAPGKLVANPVDAVSLGLALMFGTAGLPHILMRFYTVPDARAARRSVFFATGLIGVFFLLTFVIGFGAMLLVGPEAIRAADPGGNMAAPLLAERLGGTGLLGFVGAVAFATILAVVAGLTLSGAAALSHDLWVHVVRRGVADPAEELRVARVATLALGVLAVVLGITFKGQNVAFMVGLAFAIAASGNFPALMLTLFWRGTTTRGAVAAMLTGTGATLLLIYLSPTIQVDLLHRAAAPFPLRNPAIVSLPLGFLAGVVVSRLWPEPAAAAAFEGMERRAAVGTDR